ncbi:AtpZ/AtpI family protein [Alkalicella caledoniensis]|uniref:AtpZ/AtpI family protein n=1 Tax=Alkalicella caledoniensis TaxID=2731377 RepID=A0A7G9W905_ALKCA|nr:AtpZ/AtpI family protein [Alkalicella caledoniensis]QNO15167.1 AtpZ/AtpI family protein [Alkalicella caledoniensis]
MEKKHLLEVFKYLGLVTYIGILMTANILVGYYLGVYIQNITGSFLLFVLFIFLGIFSGFWTIYKFIIKLF